MVLQVTCYYMIYGTTRYILLYFTCYYVLLDTICFNLWNKCYSVCGINVCGIICNSVSGTN